MLLILAIASLVKSTGAVIRVTLRTLYTLAGLPTEGMYATGDVRAVRNTVGRRAVILMRAVLKFYVAFPSTRSDEHRRRFCRWTWNAGLNCTKGVNL